MSEKKVLPNNEGWGPCSGCSNETWKDQSLTHKKDQDLNRKKSRIFIPNRNVDVGGREFTDRET